MCRMINTVDEFMEEFEKHKDKVEWYLHKPTPLAGATDIRGRDVLCSPITVMATPPMHYHLDFIETEVEIDPSFVQVVAHAANHSLTGIREAMAKFPKEKFPHVRMAEAYELRRRLLDTLGLEEEAADTGLS